MLKCFLLSFTQNRNILHVCLLWWWWGMGDVISGSSSPWLTANVGIQRLPGPDSGGRGSRISGLHAWYIWVVFVFVAVIRNRVFLCNAGSNNAHCGLIRRSSPGVSVAGPSSPLRSYFTSHPIIAQGTINVALIRFCHHEMRDETFLDNEIVTQKEHKAYFWH